MSEDSILLCIEVEETTMLTTPKGLLLLRLIQENDINEYDIDSILLCIEVEETTTLATPNGLLLLWLIQENDINEYDITKSYCSPTFIIKKGYGQDTAPNHFT